MKTDRASHVSCETPQKDQGPSFKIPKPIDLYDIARFFSNVVVKRDDECWYYHGTILDNDYGQFIALNERWLAHRFSYTVFYEPITPDILVRHKCDNRRCVNPYHLETGTHADNARDRNIRMRTARGEKNGRSKLSDEQVLSILHDGRPHREIAKDHDIEKGTVTRIKNGRSWKHVTKIK